MPTNIINLKQIKTVNYGSITLIIAMLVMIIIPLPPFILDLLFSFNITLSLIVMMVG